MLLSHLPQIQWPAVPPPFHAQTISILYQLEATQWWTAEQLQAQQLRQLGALLSHFNRTSSFLHPRLENFRQKAKQQLDFAAFRSIPVLTRAGIRAAGPALFNTALPPGQHKWREAGSSGSTGPAIQIRKTELNDAFHAALCLRDNVWHQRDFAQSYAAIQRLDEGVAMGPDGSTADHGWVPGVETGALHSLNSAHTTVTEQVAWLQRRRPGYVFSYPSLLQGLALHCERAGITMPWIKGMKCFAEVFTPTQRADCERVFGVRPRDAYSAAEASVMAIECPEVPGTYHVQSESVLLEILDAEDAPCPVGVPGRVVVTDLHNLVTPLVRYEIGDIAEWGEPCACGRGLPVLRRIVGRTLNLLRLPNGDTLIPDIERQELHKIAPVRQAQVIQRGFNEMEVRLAADRALTDDERDQVRKAILHGLHDRDFIITFVFFDEIPRSQAGKFEAFRCEMV